MISLSNLILSVTQWVKQTYYMPAKGQLIN